MDLQALRARTRIEHEATETMLPLMDAHLQRATYVAALQTLLPVLEAWESWSSRQCPEPLRSLLEGRKRSLLILRDLEVLNASPRAEAPPAYFDRLCSDGPADERDGRNRLGTREARDACFLGALYVVEGSTLGGQFIARHVETTLGLSAGLGNAYFLGYGEQTSARWREVKGVLAEAPAEWLDESVSAARRVFGVFGEAFGAPAAT